MYASNVEQYTLMNLQEGVQYSITVNASLSDGVIAAEATTATTMTTGIYIDLTMFSVLWFTELFSQFHLAHLHL